MAALRVLEFYSGIGGLRFSLEDSGVNASLVEAFEINDRANDVYEHNFGHRPNQGNIHRLDAKDLDKYRADAWLLSPPCQPYTRQGLQKDSADARASSFLKLVDVLPSLSFPPSHILIENVVGFESSLTRDRCQKVLEAMQYHTAEFILSPLQFGIPYSRPRYFLLARRKPFSFRSSSLDNELMCKPVEAVLETPSGSETTRTNQPELDPYLLCRPLSDYLDLGPDAMQDYMVPSATVERYCHTSIDQVLLLYKELRTVRERDGLPSSYRSCRFSLSSFSIYWVAQAQTEDIQDTPLTKLGLRYFTPREIASLHCFPSSFSFPEHMSTIQRYALLGNSLNVKVVAYLLRQLFSEH